MFYQEILIKRICYKIILHIRTFNKLFLFENDTTLANYYT